MLLAHFRYALRPPSHTYAVLISAKTHTFDLASGVCRLGALGMETRLRSPARGSNLPSLA
jgi:hypothetical protein